MNQCSLIVKILTLPKQSLSTYNIPVVRMQVQFGKLRKKKKTLDEFEVSIWGKAGNHFMKYYTLGDYIIIEGRLGLKKKSMANGNHKKIKFTVKKFYPFILNEDFVVEKD